MGVWLAASPWCEAAQLELGLGVSQPALNDTEQPWAVGGTIRLGYTHPLTHRWRLNVEAGYTHFLNDTSSSSTIKFLLPNNNADLSWNLFSVDVGVDYLLSTGRTRPYVRGIVGAVFWDVQTLDGEPVPVTTPSGATTSFSAEEIAIKAALGVEHQLSYRVGLGLEAEAGYLTGIGADFSSEANSQRSRALGSVLLKLTYTLGRAPSSDPSAPMIVPAIVAGTAPEHDGTRDDDSDGDGVPDRLDRCSETPPEAAGWVDVYGCPVDIDRDGIPDYRDDCPESSGDGPVNETGCVDDADGDGVPDLVDECPDTPPGTDVDSRGCAE